MNTDSNLKALIIDDSANDIEMLVSQFRNAGLPVHPVKADDDEQLNAAIKSQTIDFAVATLQATEPSIMEVMQAIKAHNKDIPVIALDDEYDEDEANSCMEMGCRDYVSKSNTRHLILVLKREIADVTFRRKVRTQEKSVREFEKRISALLDSSRDAIAYVHEGMHIYANPVYLEMFGLQDVDEVDGMPIMDMVAPDDHRKFKEFLKRYSKETDKSESLEVKGLRDGGKVFNALMEFSPASIEGEPCTQIIIRAKTSDKELEQKLKFLSKQDVLTGLFNRQYFMEELEQAVAEAISGGTASGVVVIQPDNFKGIKEQVGIAGTDLVLGDLANIIKESIDDNIIAARFSDHSFALLVRNDDAAVLSHLCQSIMSKVEEHITDVNGQSVTFTASAGICTAGETAVNAQDVVTKADLACEMMQKDGGNKIHVHNPVADLQASKDRDQYWGHMIRDSLEHNKFRLAYQPIASLEGDVTERYEILLRMIDDEGQEVLPGQFLPIAEQSDLIVSIDKWVIAHALKTLRDRRQSGHDTIFFIKVSGKTLTDETLLPWISAILKKARMSGESIVFQISEPVAVNYLKFAKVFAQGLLQLRCGLTLEDFGNGMNSFQLLKHLPVNYLKIDGSFIHNLANNKENQAMIKSIVEMAGSLGKPVIAEFVEDPNSLTVLWQAGVQFIQGHFLQKPAWVMDFDFVGEDDVEERQF